MLASKVIQIIQDNSLDFTPYYLDPQRSALQPKRYTQALQAFIDLYGDKDIAIFSVPGRSEVSGNHTDHQRGQVLATSVNMDMIAVAAKTDSIIKVKSDDLDIPAIEINDLQPHEEEYGTSTALIRGVVAGLKNNHHTIGGFQAYITSDVLSGSGLSSSAAFEGLIGFIESGLYNDMAIDPVEISKIGQHSENVFFGKPCGLMDQCACCVGGLIHIDFKDPHQPIVNKVDVDFSRYNHSLCIVDVHASHADLTDDYAAVPAEMKQVARYFDKDVLRDVDPKDFYSQLADIRKTVSDRALLRTIHFFNENDRVQLAVDALQSDDFKQFCRIITESGKSSFTYLQNVYSNHDVENQAVSLALALSENILKEHGVCRVHGGGFAGTIQAFVQDTYVQTYKEEIEKVFGKGSCHILKIRNIGGVKIL